MKTLREILNGTNNINIMYRTNSPIPEEEDMLFGYCKYENGKLISIDGDSYSLDDMISKYEFVESDEHKNSIDLIVWIESEWSN